MGEHPIEGLMKTAMQSIKEMVDVNTIVGDAVQAPDGTVIIPISKVSFGFASGGGEYNSCCSIDDGGGGGDEEGEEREKPVAKFPFAGGSGAGVSISPVAFMVVGHDQFKLIPVNLNSSVDKILDLVPELLSKVNESLKKKMNDKNNKKDSKASPAGEKCGNTPKEAEEE